MTTSSRGYALLSTEYLVGFRLIISNTISYALKQLLTKELSSA